MSEFTAKASTNYTEDMISVMEANYSANPTRETAEMLAVEFDKPVRSVIAKLSSMGIYKAQARATKAGVPVERKEAMVDEIQTMLGVEVESLAKATKNDLIKMRAALAMITAIEG